MQTRIILALLIVFFGGVSFGQTQQQPDLKEKLQLEGLLPYHVPAGEITKPGVLTQPGYKLLPDLPGPGSSGQSDATAPDSL